MNEQLIFQGNKEFRPPLFLLAPLHQGEHHIRNHSLQFHKFPTKHIDNKNGQENQEQDIQDHFHKKRRLFSRVDYIAGKNVRDSNGKFKCGLRIDMDLDAVFDFA